jgi:guanine nucleotide-binding protein subunit alpha, other
VVRRQPAANARIDPANKGIHAQKNMAHIMVEYEMRADEPLPMDYLEPVKRLWLDGGVQQAILKGNEYALHDNLS